MSASAHRLASAVLGLGLAFVAWILMSGIGTASANPKGPDDPAAEQSSQAAPSETQPPPTKASAAPPKQAPDDGRDESSDAKAGPTTSDPAKPPDVQVGPRTAADASGPEVRIEGDAASGSPAPEEASEREADAPAPKVGVEVGTAPDSPAPEEAPEGEADAEPAPPADAPAPGVRVEVGTAPDSPAPEEATEGEAGAEPVPESSAPETPEGEADEASASKPAAPAPQVVQQGDADVVHRTLGAVDRSAGTELAPIATETPELSAGIDVNLALPLIDEQKDGEDLTGTTGLVSTVQDLLAVELSLRTAPVGPLPGISLDVAPVDWLANPVLPPAEHPSPAPPADADDSASRGTDGGSPAPSHQVSSPLTRDAVAWDGDSTSDRTQAPTVAATGAQRAAKTTTMAESDVTSLVPHDRNDANTSSADGSGGGNGSSLIHQGLLSVVPAGSGSIGGSSSSSGGGLAAPFGAAPLVLRPTGSAAFTGDTGAIPDDLIASPDHSPD